MLDICSLSDLHLDYKKNWDVAEAMAYRLIELSPDVLILAGDLASTPKLVKTVLKFFKPLASHVVFVPGNHDLWAPTEKEALLKNVNTWHAYRHTLPEVCEELGIHYLPSAPLVLGETALVGTCGWYDYSLASPLARQTFDDAQFQVKKQGRYQWVDHKRIRWRDEQGSIMADGDVARILESELEAQLEGLDEAVTTVVGICHHVPSAAVCKGHMGLAGDFFTAFMGSTGLGRVFQGDSRVKHLIFGHQHRPISTQIGELNFLSTPLGTPRDWSGSPKAVAMKRMGQIQLAASLD